MVRDQLAIAAALKDENAAHPVAAAWRPILCEVVRAFVRGDYVLSRAPSGVDTVPKDLADQMRACVADYGATLVELPDDTWEASCAQWMGGHWDVLVDLWTKEKGRSDLVLGLRVAESDAQLRFTVQFVHVP